MNMIDFLNQLDLGQKLMGGLTAFVGILFGAQKLKSFWKRESVENSKINIEKTLIDSLHEEFIRINTELESARGRQDELNNLIHTQTLKINRMEFMMLKMYMLLTHNEIEIPEDLKDHLDGIITMPQSNDR